MSEILLNDIKDFQNRYLENPVNREYETKIKAVGLTKALINNEVVNNHSFQFNIELPEVGIYNQKNSYECNIYAFLRVFKSVMTEDKTINLSANYLEFFDKLEKVNTFYNELFKLEKVTLKDINRLANFYIAIFGNFHCCVELINKYGVVLSSEEDEVSDNYNAVYVVELLKKKVKIDALSLINRDKKNDEELKKELLQEAYNFLAKNLGMPNLEVNYEGNIYTPQEFKQFLVGNRLDDFITIILFPKEDFLDSNCFVPNVYLNRNEPSMTLRFDKVYDAMIKQLKDGIAVWFSSEETVAMDYDLNIIDDNIFSYEELLNIKKVDRDQLLPLELIDYDHAMTITGALVENGEVKQFKVDNSFGKHGKFKGAAILTRSGFENCVTTIIIDKKYIK